MSAENYGLQNLTDVQRARLVEVHQRLAMRVPHPEGYGCQWLSVLEAKGPCRLVRFKVGTTGVLYVAYETNLLGDFTDVKGPAALLCGKPVAGGPPWLCGEHFLQMRDWEEGPEGKAARLRREKNRQRKKEGL